VEARAEPRNRRRESDFMKEGGRRAIRTRDHPVQGGWGEPGLSGLGRNVTGRTKRPSIVRLFEHRPCPPGPGAPWWGVQRGLCCFLAPFARRRPVSSDTVGRSACPNADNVPDAPSPTRTDYEPSGESSTPIPQSGRPLLTTVPHGSASGGKGVRPPCRRLPAHVGFELWELCRQGRGSSAGRYSDFQSRMTFPDWPLRIASKPFSNSVAENRCVMT